MATRRSEDSLAGDGAHLVSDAFASDPLAGDGSHLANDTVVALAYYNVGIQNDEILGAKWKKPSSENEKNSKMTSAQTLKRLMGFKSFSSANLARCTKTSMHWLAAAVFTLLQ